LTLDIFRGKRLSEPVILVPDSASGKGNTIAKKRISQILVAFGVLAQLQFVFFASIREVNPSQSVKFLQKKKSKRRYIHIMITLQSLHMSSCPNGKKWDKNQTFQIHGTRCTKNSTTHAFLCVFVLCPSHPPSFLTASN
jgi:hypothetical protein